MAAPAQVLAARLAQWQRPSDGNLDARVARVAACDADVVIRNVCRPEVGVRQALNVIRDPGTVLIS